MEVDIRTRSSEERHRILHLLLEELEPGRAVRIVDDHDPWPARSELEDAHPGCLTWTYVESGPLVWRVEILKTHQFEPLEDVDLLADSPRLRITQIRVPAGTKGRVLHFADEAALMITAGAGMLELSGRRRAISAGIIEIVCGGETCALSAATDIQAYVAIAKSQR